MALASSPLSSLTPPVSDISGGDVALTATLSNTSTYRLVRPLPFELAQHVQTYYEENLLTQAYNFLLSISTNSVSAFDCTSPILLPPTTHLALASTIAIHPRFTTRTTDTTKLEQSGLALKYLRFLHSVAGPVNANLASAFEFQKYHHHKPTRSFFNTHDQSPTKSEEDNKLLNTPYADVESLYILADDFWAVVGWALNCSVLALSGKMHARRWQCWSIWLEFMLDVLETDWDLRHATKNCEESLIWQYIELANRSSNSARRMLRAIFAHDSTKSTNEFRMIFKNELKEPVDKEQERLKKNFKQEEMVDVDNEIYGDYLAENDSDDSEENDSQLSTKKPRTRTPSSRRLTPRASGQSLRSDYDTPETKNASSASDTNLGDPTSIRIRVRLLHLLSNVAAHPDLTSTSPTTFPDYGELCILFIEHIKPLPLVTFQSIVCSPASFTYLSPDTHTTLAEVLLQRLLEPDARFDTSTDNFLTQQKLETNYLPFATATGSGSGRLSRDSGDRGTYHSGGGGSNNVIEMNAKVSLLLEVMMRRLLHARILRGTDGLLQAVMRGVQRRLDKVGSGLSKKVGSSNAKTGTRNKNPSSGNNGSAGQRRSARSNVAKKEQQADADYEDEDEDTIVVKTNDGTESDANNDINNNNNSDDNEVKDDDDDENDDDDDSIDELALSSEETTRRKIVKHFGKAGKQETEAWHWLFESGERMILIARTLEA